jgi:hypothetical protein
MKGAPREAHHFRGGTDRRLGPGLIACGSSDDPLASSTPTGSAPASGGSGGPIVVGGANFSESTLLAEIYGGALTARGMDASTKPNIGSREVYLLALEDHSVQVFREYTGVLAFDYDKEYTGTDPDEVYQKVQRVLPRRGRCSTSRPPTTTTRWWSPRRPPPRRTSRPSTSSTPWPLTSR